MGQDIREMFRSEESLASYGLKKGHQQRFKSKLEAGLHQSRHSFLFFKIAAVLIFALGVGFYLLAPQNPFGKNAVVETNPSEEKKGPKPEKEFQLSDISPEYKKVENFYLTSLHVDLARLHITEENKEVIDSFMGQLAELDKEYQRLNKEVRDNGLNNQYIDALINNLQLRLELMFMLKNKLKEIKSSKEKAYEDLQI